MFSHILAGTTSIIVRANDKDLGEWRTTYGECSYQGTWWAPDSRKYVIALKHADRDYLVLESLEYNNSSNLSAYLSMGVAMNELAEYGFQYADDGMWPEIEYQFLQWSSDSTSMLIYYSFFDANQSLHSGYFWYNCENGTVYAPFELDVSQ